MEPMLWWVLLIVLVTLITAIAIYLCYSVIKDRSSGNRHIRAPHKPALSEPGKNQFDLSDKKDLTSIETDLKKLLPQIEFVDGVHIPTVTSRGSLSKRRVSLLPDIHESIDSVGGFYSIEDIMNELRNNKGGRRGSDVFPIRRYSLMTQGMRRNSLTLRKFSFVIDPNNRTSTDTIDCVDATIVETKRDIANVEAEAKKIDYEIDYFIGGKKNLKFYEINEKLIRLNMALSRIHCNSENEELRRRKKQVQSYISECQEKLNNKV